MHITKVISALWLVALSNLPATVSNTTHSSRNTLAHLASDAPNEQNQYCTVQVTADSSDPLYNSPHIEVDEERSDPVPHRYVYGRFNNTAATFSFYFPPPDQYRGRFFHNTYPLIVSSDIGPFPIDFDVAKGNLGFTLDSGAYYVQSNLGGNDGSKWNDTAIRAYRVNAATAKYSRDVASRIYGDHRPYGFLFGGSGGSYQVMAAAESTNGVWDGFLPYVHGTPYSAPSVFTVRLHTLRILGKAGKFPGIVDALSPGGSDDPYAELNEIEAAALKESSLLGFPLRAWFDWQNLTSGYLPPTVETLKADDPTYVDDFWSQPGYLGGNPEDPIHNDRVQFETTITNIHPGKGQPTVEFAESPGRRLEDADIIVLEGPDEGRLIATAVIDGTTATFPWNAGPDVIKPFEQGQKVRIDNSWTLALQTSQRHQVPTSLEFYGWNQFRNHEGRPSYPQRAENYGRQGTLTAASCIPRGNTHGKTLTLQTLLDIDAFPWQADWYRRAAKKAHQDAFDDKFATYFIDNAQHDNPASARAEAHIVNFDGALQQGLRDLAGWVEEGRRPSNTKYAVIDSQVHVPARAAERGGIQPVVHLRANGRSKARVAPGQAVNLTATIESPPGAGLIISAEWDFEGTGNFQPVEVASPQPTVTVNTRHTFLQPGTYFVVLRATLHREGDQVSPYAQVKNLGRARVIVA